MRLAALLTVLLLVGCAGRDTKTASGGTKLLTEQQMITALQRHGIQAHGFPKGPPNGEAAAHVDDVFKKLFSSWHVTGGAVGPKIEAFVTDSADHASDLYRSSPPSGPSRKHPKFIFSRAFTVSNVVVLVFSPLRIDAVKAAMRDLTAAAHG
jgi:hypothetical protein